jgi:hypothetical protein
MHASSRTSHVGARSVGRSELPNSPTTTNHKCRFANTVLLLYHCHHRVPFPTPKMGTNSCSQTLAPCPSYNIRKILAPRKAEPPLTAALTATQVLPTVRSRRKGLSTEVFLRAEPRTSPRPHYVKWSCHDHVAYSHTTASVCASTRTSLYYFYWTTRCAHYKCGFFNKGLINQLYGV